MRSITLTDKYTDNLIVTQYRDGEPFMFQTVNSTDEATVVLDLDETAKLVAFLQGDTSHDDKQDPDGRMAGDVLVARYTCEKVGQATVFAEREYRVVKVETTDGTKSGTYYRVHHLLGREENTAVVPSEYFYNN